MTPSTQALSLAAILSVTLLPLHSAVVGAWNPNNDTDAVSANVDLANANTASFTRLTGQNADAGNFLSYQEFGLVATSGSGNYAAVNSNLYLGASLVTDASDGYRLRESRFRIRSTSPDVVQLLTEFDVDGGTGVYSGVYALDLTPGTTLADLSSVAHHANGFRTVRFWAELSGGTQIVSDSFVITTGLNDYAINYSSQTWSNWLGASTFDSTGGVVSDSDFSWSKTVGGAADTLDGTEIVTKFGFTWEVSDLSDGWSTNSTVISAIPEPSIAVFAAGLLSLALVAQRRRS